MNYPPPTHVSSRCEASAESQGKPDDIQALEMKLRSLFMDLGGGVPHAQGEAELVPGVSVGGTSSPKGVCTPVTTPVSMQPANAPQTPSSLALGSAPPIQGPGASGSAPVQVAASVVSASSFGQTTPSKAPLSRGPVSHPE